ncbi:MAG TPA: glycosyltransferase [Dongiaceae bacterium]|nr:glycosyltransferase [Dongiaceae bacterium]
MKTGAALHAEGLALFRAGRYQDALRRFQAALAITESAELWNDWAAAQYSMGAADEAAAGFLLAVTLDHTHREAAENLAALQSRSGSTDLRCSLVEPSELRRWVSDDENERSYFKTHEKRYLETLRLLPDAGPGTRLLELGAAFHHLTPLLIRNKGYAQTRCNDLWQGATRAKRELHSADGTEQLCVHVDNFDVQHGPWPYEDAAFDAVLCCEMLEHFHSDPMGVLAEINRVLAPGGLLLLTTPNLASAHSVECALRGSSPYVYGKFEVGGASTDRHNREYTAGEVERLTCAAGFVARRLLTQDSWWQPSRDTLRLLASRGEPVARRGDNIFFLGQKDGAVRERFPEEFYLRLGTQTDRRMVQSAEPSGGAPPAATSLRLIVLHEVVPRGDRSGADLRLLDVLHELRAQGHAVTLLARDAAESESYTPALENAGIRVMAGDAGKRLPELLQREAIDAVIFCHWFWTGVPLAEEHLRSVRQLAPATRVAILTDDRHGERERRAARLSGLLSDEARGDDFEARELAAYRSADLLLYIAETDAAHFRAALAGVPMEHLPIVGPQTDESERPASERSGVLFLGNFENLANRDALQWLRKEVWPRVRAGLPGLKLFVAGNGCAPEPDSEDGSIVFLGRVANLATVLHERLAMVSPVRFGTGINTKNLQALAHGLPVVTTTIGAEGLGLQHQRHALIADDAAGFAHAIERVCTDPNLRQRLAGEGRRLVAETLSHAHFSGQVRKVVERLRHLPAKLLVDPELDSYRAVEQSHPEVLHGLWEYRGTLRVLAYWQRGAAALAAGEAQRALREFRHIFVSVRGMLPDTTFHRQLLQDMHDAYRRLGDRQRAARITSEMNKLVRTGIRAPVVARPRRKEDGPQLSVVLPTCNRCETLRLSLAALAFQTLETRAWEVVVVDDGSTDETPHYLSTARLPFPLRVVRQENQGAGAARRAGVAAARGAYVLLCNDDTICASSLLETHLNLQRKFAGQRLAVLGQFQASQGCRRSALAFWLQHSPFLFPQQALQAGQICDAAFFVTCNLSVARQAILDAGNFDPAFRVAEDTELGARLQQSGYRVRFEPAAMATHEHGSFTTDDLLRRAQVYGEATWKLLGKHPQLLGDGGGPFGKLQEADFARLRKAHAHNAEAAAAGVFALRALDDLDLLPLWKPDPTGQRPLEAIIEKTGAIVPTVYWHYLFQSFLAAAGQTQNQAGRKTTDEPVVRELAAP